MKPTSKILGHIVFSLSIIFVHLSVGHYMIFLYWLTFKQKDRENIKYSWKIKVIEGFFRKYWIHEMLTEKKFKNW